MLTGIYLASKGAWDYPARVTEMTMMHSSGHHSMPLPRSGYAGRRSKGTEPGTRWCLQQTTLFCDSNHLWSGNALAQLTARNCNRQPTKHGTSGDRIDQLDRPPVPEVIPLSRTSRLRSRPNQKRHQNNVEFFARSEKPALRRATPLRGKSPPPQQWRPQPRQSRQPEP